MYIHAVNYECYRWTWEMFSMSTQIDIEKRRENENLNDFIQEWK